ncbi:TIGR03746 family integrating conjugative element protein [Serratia marcescens]|nr:TIGR03746 family integrating conjugative element protein [Serratia marcescens]ELQ9442297.1 TIGR03746 family integrating conjugative element protein [Serratia marcescens]ELT5563057.1 TIGR03746 family integrating conjugative element protein [Serratia marcescens]
MSRFRHAVKNRDQHILTLRVACGVLVVFLLVASIGWMRAPANLTIHNPPDLRSGSTRAWWEVPPSTVYAFTFYIAQQLNAWPKNGEVDYPARIAGLSAYLTPSCARFLAADAKKRTDNGELAGRTRVVFEIPDHGYNGRYNPHAVDVKGRDNWVVNLDLAADEYFAGEPVKRALIRYPIRVVRWEGDPERNPFGLALDCFDSVPQRLAAAPEADKPEKKGVFQ